MADVYAEGAGLASRHSRYHRDPTCPYRRVLASATLRKKPLGGLFAVDEARAVESGWWQCPYCSEERPRGN